MNTPTEENLERSSNVIKWLGVIVAAILTVGTAIWGAIELAWSLKYEGDLKKLISEQTLITLSDPKNINALAQIQLIQLASLSRAEYEKLPLSQRLQGNLVEEMLSVPDLEEFRKRVDSVYSFEMSRLYPTVFRDGLPPQPNTNPEEGGVPIENSQVRLFLNRNDTVRLYAFEDIKGPNGRVLTDAPASIWLQIGSSPEDKIPLDGALENFSLNCMLERVFRRRQDGENKAVDVSVHFEAFGSAAVEYNYDLFFMITKEERELGNCV